MTESPRRNSFGMKRSLFTGFEPFFPRPVFGICTHPAICLLAAGKLKQAAPSAKQRSMPQVGGLGITSVHISLTFSRTMLQWRSNAFTRPSSFLLLRQFMSTCAGSKVYQIKRGHTAPKQHPWQATS